MKVSHFEDPDVPDSVFKQDEAEAPHGARLFVFDDADLLDLAEPAEVLPQVLFGDVVGQADHEDLALLLVEHLLVRGLLVHGRLHLDLRQNKPTLWPFR